MSLMDGLVFKKLSEKKKKKQTKFNVPSKTKKKQEFEKFEKNDEELNNSLIGDGDDGNNTEFKEVEKELNERKMEINFQLNVSQSLAMFFDRIDPQVTIVSGSVNYDKQYRKLVSSNVYPYKSMKEKLEKTLEYPRLDVEHYPRAKSLSFVQQLLNRSDHLCCMSSNFNYLFIYGGRSGNILHDDFIRYDIEANIMYVYKNLHLASHFGSPFHENIRLPKGLCGCEMIEDHDIIYIFGKNETYRIENVSGTLNVAYESSLEETALPDKSYLTMTKVWIENVMYIYAFGGKSSSGSITDDTLYRIQFKKDRFLGYYVNCQPFPSVGIWPAARYGHSACNVASSIFIYGGITTGDKMLNDLFMLDTLSNTWTEIVPNSYIPPPLFKHCSFSINDQSFFVFGGNLSEEMSNCFFRFDINTNKWNLIEVASEDIKRNMAAKLLRTPNGEVFAVGSSLQEKNFRSFSKSMNTEETLRSVPLYQYLEDRRVEGYLCDVAFKVKDLSISENSSSYILAHKCIIKARCPTLYGKIQSCTTLISTDQFNGTFLENEISCVELLDCDFTTLTKYLTYLYTGSIHVPSTESIKFLSFVKSISESRHYPSIEKIVNLKTLETTREIFKSIQDDIGNLLGDSIDSDVTLVLNQNLANTEATNEDSSIDAHRLFLSRSPLFSKLLVKSGMLETREKVVHLDYSKEVMQDVLKYMYTNKIQLKSSNAIGLLVHSLLFEMEDLTERCRFYIVSLLDISTVCSIFEVANFHNDEMLQNACENFMVDNFPSLSKSPTFIEVVPEKTRLAIQLKYEKKCQKKLKDNKEPKIRMKERHSFFF